MNKYFKYKERGSTLFREILCGLIVFFAMIYVLPTNSTILGSCGGSKEAIFIATCITSGFACILMGLLANYPLALSAGMGMNAFIAYTVCGNFGYSFDQALLMALISGILFLILTISPLRLKIITSIPKSLRSAISAGLGGFVCFVGLKSGGIITSSVSTFVKLGDFSSPTVLLSIFGVIIVFILMQFKGKISQLAIVIAMLITAFVGFILGLCGIENMPHFTWTNVFDNYGAFFNNVGSCFSKDSFSIFTKIETYAVIFSLLFVNLFDSTATLIVVGEKAGIIDGNGEITNGKKAMLSDSIGSLICPLLGTTTLTNFAESLVGVESGAKTGISAITTGIMFLLSTFMYPIFSIFSSVENGLTPVTSLALISVGSMMFANIKNIDWDDKIIVSSSFIIIIMMILCYSISDGLGIGLIFYSFMMIASKRGKEVSPFIYIISLFFILNYVINSII